MSDINWKENTAFLADTLQYKIIDGKCYYYSDAGESWCSSAHNIDHLLGRESFQLNEIRTGDFIPASELDTEQKYNEVVEVFVLFGFPRYEDCQFHEERSTYIFADGDGDFTGTNELTDCTGRQLTYNQIITIGKLKRMMLEREKSAPKKTPDLTPDFTKASSNKYEREITDRQGNSATVDVYDVLKAFNVTCPATQHALKKLLCSGLRGHKDLQTDLIEAKESIVRAIELN